MPPVFRFARQFGSHALWVAVCTAFACAFPGSTSAQQAVPASQPMPALRLDLKRSAAQQADLAGFLVALQTPGSSEYRHWLTPEQFAQRFSPGKDAGAAATVWLQQQGFQVGGVSRNGMRVSFSGTAAQVQRSFAVRLNARSVTGNQLTAISASSTPVLPTSTAFAAAALGGLNAGAILTNQLDLLAVAIEQNARAAVVLRTTDGADPASQKELSDEAAAQGITVLQTEGELLDADSGSIVALGSKDGAVSSGGGPRPAWQSAPGLPENSFRAVPDAVLEDASALADALGSFAAEHARIGAVAPWLYRFREDTTVLQHTNSANASGTWTANEGLGVLNVSGLLKAIANAEAGTVVALTTSNTTVTHGQPFSATVSVTINSSQTPTGTATVTLKGRNGNTVTLGPSAIVHSSSGDSVTLSTNTLPSDIYDISAVYNSTAGGSTTSNTVTTTVLQENAVITATAPSTMLGATIPVTITASSASGVGVPSGTVTVTAYGTGTSASSPPVYTATLPSSSTSTATAVVSVPATSVGSFTFQANCTTGGSFACNQPQSFAVTVTQATPTVSLTSTPQAVVANSATQKYDVTVTVAPPSGVTTVPTGSVDIQDNGKTVATITLSKGAGTYTLSLSGTGHSLVAAYGGDTNFAAASSAAVAVNAPLITTTTALTASPTSVSFGSATSLTATVTPGSYAASGAPTGTVTFRSSLQGTFATATLANGTVTYSATTLQVGTHTITASYPGDTNYAASVSSAITVTVTPGKVTTTTTLTVSPTQPLAGQNTVLTATVAPSNTAAAGTTTAPIVCTGQVTFFSNNIFLANGSLANGTVSVTARLAGGSNSLTAVYNGDTTCFGSTSSAVVVSPARVGSVIALQSSVSYANAGQTIQLSAQVSAADANTVGVPTGTVTFYDTRSGVLIALGSAVLAGNGTNAIAILNVNGLTAGPHSFSATYSGDSIFLPATSQSLTVSFGDFSLSLSPQSLTIARGSTATAIGTLTVTGGFSSSVVLSCQPPASSLITCVFVPSTLTGGGSSTLTVTTTASTTRAIGVQRSAVHWKRAALGGGVAFAAMLLWPTRRRRLASLLVLVLCGTFMAGGCSLSTVDSTNNLPDNGSGSGSGSGSGTSTGTPLGTQLLTVTASSGDGTLRHTYTYPVNVQ